MPIPPTADDTVRVTRREVPAGHQLSLLRHVYVERGTAEDWKALEALHYKSSNLGVGPRYMRCVLDQGDGRPETIGVMVFTVPKPLDAGRNVVFPHLKPNQNGRDTKLMNVSRMHWINRNLLLSSRTVLDTMYRGAGIAYRFKNLGYRMMGYRYIESRSSMSRFNPFSEKAGMRFVPPRAAPAMEQGLQFCVRHFKGDAHDYAAIMAELRAMPDWEREHVLGEMRAFYYRHSAMEKSGEKRLAGTSRVDQLDVPTLVRQFTQIVFGATIYAVWSNPDYGRELPARIPLLAFHNQAPDEPLRLDLL